MDPMGGPRMKARPPEKGSFPLDHKGVCKDIADSFLKCIRHHPQMDECREWSRKYIECRMDNNLMTRESLTDLGFSEQDLSVARPDPLVIVATVSDSSRVKEKQGFVAGAGLKQRRPPVKIE